VGLSVLSFLSMLGVAFIFLRLWYTERKAPRLSRSVARLGSVEEKLPFVSLVVTARNEEEKIGRCLESLESQTYPNLEILVVDDSSSDRTLEIANRVASKEARMRIIIAGQKPEGWVGKSWPCWRGYKEAKGSIICFVDADTTFAPVALESSVRYLLEKNYDVLSFSAKVRLEGIWSHATLPFISGAINLFYPMISVNDPKSKRAYVFGSFALFRREVYESIGGHEAVRNRIVEDAALGENAKSAGYKLRVEIGNEFATTDWENERSSIFHGLQRVMSHSVRSWGLVAALNAVLFFFVGLYPTFLAIGVLVYASFNPATFSASSALIFALATSVVAMGFIIATGAHELKLVAGKAGLYPILYPLGCAMFILAIFATSIKMTSGKGLEWKGASYVQAVVREQAAQ
jgi:chlorobactene glucosyltransferase